MKYFTNAMNINFNTFIDTPNLTSAIIAITSAEYHKTKNILTNVNIKEGIFNER